MATTIEQSDILQDYISETIRLSSDYEGEVIATLISSKFNHKEGTNVLYLHGYIDYFFQAHLGHKFIENGYNFYALDMRKYGRSLLPHQHPNYCRDIEEYFEEISIAIRKISERSSGDSLLLGHSTGGLIASNYMNRGEEKNRIKGLILNSPFLDFPQSKWVKIAVTKLIKPLCKVAPYAKIEGVLSPAYAQSIHQDYYGEWHFNLKWKPIKGFSTYLRWMLSITAGQKRLETSDIKVPILILHSKHSSKVKTFTDEAMRKDIVLNVEDIKRIGKKLGKEVAIVGLLDSQHDVFLSPKHVREEAFDKMFSWLRGLDSLTP